MNDILKFVLYYGSAIAASIRIVSSIISIFFCIPLQIKEARVNNGLRLLRYQLLFFGITIIVINILTINILIDYVLNNQVQKIGNILIQIFNAIGFLSLSIVGYRIYTQQYSEENKEKHEKIDKLP